MINIHKFKSVLLSFLLLGILTSPNQVSMKSASPTPTQVVSTIDNGQADQTVYLPLILKTGFPPIFGVETTWFDPHQFNMASGSRANWLRGVAISWEAIEPVRTDPPTYHWETVNEYAIQEASARGFSLIATIKYTPSWAQKYQGYSCGPVSVGAMPAFVEFMQALVAQYSASPFNIKYWELGNEPDVDPYEVGFSPNITHAFGCWGDNNDNFYGGRFYATMLKNMYQPVKTVDPEAQILIGGLLLDCDHTNPPAGKDCKPSKFLEGILYGGGGDYFDIVNIHAYSNWTEYSGLQNDIYWPSWDKRGGIVMGKIDFVREIMAKYSVDKPIIITESGVLCPEQDPICNPPPAEFFEAQADYVVWLYARTWAAGVSGTIWYTLTGPGWRYAGLLDEYQNPRPAYFSYKYMTEKLAGTTFTQTLPQYPELRSFEFTKPGRRIWILYAEDELPHTVTLPPQTLSVFDKYGHDITPPDDQITVNSPVYVELLP